MKNKTVLSTVIFKSENSITKCIKDLNLFWLMAVRFKAAANF